jgi:membrane-bound serine protease (ClpP class)
MHVSRRGPLAFILLLSAISGGATLRAIQTASVAPTPVVLSAEVDAIIHPVSAEYMVETINRAETEHAALVVFTLRTPGGLVDATRTIVTRLIASKVPVAVFVGPSGARAASAGFFITLSSDVAVMAPGTHIGAAHPVAGQGEQMDETMAKKVTSDLAAYARTLATERHRNVELAEQAVRDSRAFTEREALDAKPPLIDLIATNVGELVRTLDGRTVTRFDGHTEVLHTAGARIVPIEMTLRQRVLSALAHPNVAYILLSLGVLGLTIELWSPGAVLPGVAGGICLLLAFFAFQVLPVNYAGLLLILFGLTLLVLEIKVTSYGLLGVGGLVSLVLGSMILIDAPTPELRVSLSLVVPVALALSGITLFLVRLAMVSQRRRPFTGGEGLVGEHGRALTDIHAAGQGQVAVHGEVWSATALESIPAGEAISITAVDGLLLTVRRWSAGSGRVPASPPDISAIPHRDD